jgi:magnesium-protoporphyrin O-methyltransferase
MANNVLETSSRSDKEIVKDYFNSTGFDRWRRIYGDTDEINKVQRDIRQGHQQTVDYVVDWFRKDPQTPTYTVCDAGCGTGSLAIPLAQLGATVYATDISEKMVGEGQTKAAAQNLDNLTFGVSDLAALTGEYHTVVCLDVLIHYPDDESAAMIAHLASLAQSRLVLSFAPKNPYYVLMKKVGDLVPGPSKATRAYLHREKDVRQVLRDLGFKVKRHEFTASQFYFSRLLEAVRP